MVVTRSQGDIAELEERQRREQPTTSHEEEERRRIEIERVRRLTMEPPASPISKPTSTERREITTLLTATAGTSCQTQREERSKSPARSVRSHRSTTSVNTRLRMAELEAAEKLAVIRRKELELEAELIKKRLAAEVSVIQDDQESTHEEPVGPQEGHRRVDEWLQTNPRTDHKQLRFDVVRESSPTPTRTKGDIEHLAATLEKMARPRLKQTDLPTFSGAINEWLPFKAAMQDSTKIYHVSAAENIQRLRSCLKGEARDAVAALLHTATDPDVIMRTLEQCFGRPEVIIDKALEDLKRLQKPGSSATELNHFAIKLQNIVCILKTIDRRGYLYNPLLAREVLDKLSPHVRSRWCDYASEYEETADPEIVTLSRFLMREADRALRYSYAPSTSAAARKETRNPAVIPKRKLNAVYNTMEEQDRCPECGQGHKMHQCPKYQALTVERRWDFLKAKKICFKCAHYRHRRGSCQAKSCGVRQCDRPHHASLHYDKEDKPATESEPQSDEAVLSVAANQATGAQTVLLKMCPVVVAGPRGEVNTYALLDEGATITLIDEDLARKVGAEGPRHPLYLHGVNMSQKQETSKLVTVQVRGKSENTSHSIKARTIKDMKLHRQTVPENIAKYAHLRDLEQDVICYATTRPGILVGTDHWEIIVSQELRVGKPSEPAASRTQLGWVVHGTVPRRIIKSQDSVLHVTEKCTGKHEDERLHNLVEFHFTIDALGVAQQRRVSEADQRAMKLVQETIKKTKDGYEVGLPWRQDKIKMPPSYDQAFRRLKSMERKMDSDPTFAAEYTTQIENLLKKGYAEPCDGSEMSSRVGWFLPHFAVQNINKPGKQRLVFDAAAKSNGVSLNSQLLEGPDLLLSLPGILFRFREKAIAVTADIQEMFLRVKIRKEDQPAQGFLWRGMERSDPPRHFKMSSMIFGAASSPFMAHFVRNYNAEQHGEEYPKALEAITKSHYMDDFVASYDNIREAQRAIHETRKVHAEASFTLRQWSASHEDALRDVPTELRANSFTPLGGDEQENKILGLIWNADKDELGFNTSMNRVPEPVRAQKRAPTKREALSAVMSIYDPLGLLSSYTIRAKIILQSLWRLKISWDESIPDQEKELFYMWLSQLEEITKLRLPRCYALGGYFHTDLHVFCDASEQAYAAVAYWRVTSHDGRVQVALVAAKAKVAPRRTQTIPRLELQAAIIGARLATHITKEHGIAIRRTMYWSDSSTVVHWIRHDARRYTPFVAHRLGELAELTHRDEWRWLPTKENVADDATRLDSHVISDNDRWFQGPHFLYKHEDEWPTEDKSQEEVENEAEVLHITDAGESWLPQPERFSKYETLVRATARALAFIDICRRRATEMEYRHIERAEKELIKQAQQDSFGKEISNLQAARPIKSGSRLFRLDPVLEEDVLRVRGRIQAATTHQDAKRPIILDGRHRLTRLLVLREHCAAGHANRERVTNDLRQRYWVIHLRPTVRAIEKECSICRIRRARPRAPIMGDLPRARLDAFHRPFTNCGVDYFGPMTVKVGRRREKRWGALFTCLTTRAVHIEVVTSLTTDSAIMALRRMAARRGWPRLMYSDNATNFRGADQELRAAYNEWSSALKDEGWKHRMEWRYIPPGAPNQGGAWERLVRSVKNALDATLREKAPAEEVLTTLLTEAEFSVNARPLTHVSVSPDDPEALTPNHFLLGTSNGLPITGPCADADRRVWRASQALADQFWRRWLREYLPTLIPRGESLNERRQLRTGDIVIVADGTLPRNVWPRGIVERVYEGPDGGVRVADVRTRTGTFKRPTSKLVVLRQEEATRAAPGGGC